MSRSDMFSAGHVAAASSIVEFPAREDLQQIGPLLAPTFPDVVVSKRRTRKVDSSPTRARRFLGGTRNHSRIVRSRSFWATLSCVNAPAKPPQLK